MALLLVSVCVDLWYKAAGCVRWWAVAGCLLPATRCRLIPCWRLLAGSRQLAVAGSG